MSIDKGKNKKGINEVLRAATEENERVRTYERTLISQIIEPDAQPADERDAASAVGTAAGDINDEAKQIVSKYSAHKPLPELSGTDELKRILDEKSVSGVLPKETEKSQSRLAGELKEQIEDAKRLTQTDAEKMPSSATVGTDAFARFAEPVGHIHKREPIQETMFDTEPEPDPMLTQEIETTRFDDDYAALSEKISSGEIDFVYSAHDDDDYEDQLVFSKDDEGDLNSIIAAVDDEKEKQRRSREDSFAETRAEAFAMMNESSEDFDDALDRLSKRRTRREKSAEKPKEFEYTSPTQNTDISVMLKKAIRISALKVAATVFFAVLILLMEISSSGSDGRPEFLKQGRYGMLYILIDLQLLFFSALVLIRNVKSGIEGIIKRRPGTDSLLVISILVTAIYSVVMMSCDPTSAGLQLYSLPAAMACVCAAVTDCMRCRKDLHCFRVLAKKHKKYAALELEANAPETAEFTKYLSEDSAVYTVKKTEFCDGMFRRTRSRSRTEDVIGFIIPVMLVLAVILFAVLAIAGRSMLDAYASATLLILILSPLSAFFMVSLPIAKINRIGRKTSSAFVGNTVAEEYADAGVLSFADTEVYPTKNISILSVKAYGNFRIDTVIPELASVFTLLGGPLSSVLKNMVDGVTAPPENSKLIESAADGVCVSLGGRHFSVGKRSYLRRYKIDAPVDNGDTAFEQKRGTVMYVAIDDAIAAKVYLKYTVNRRFNNLLKDMYRAGLCLGVKTLDPNITNEMLQRDITFKKCPITVVKCSRFGESTAEEARIDSGIVTNSSLHTFLKMFALCDKARHVVRSNVIITVAGIFLSFVAVAFLAITGSPFEVGSLQAVLFQLVWLIPVWCMSLFL